jgi:hypothetical protein
MNWLKFETPCFVYIGPFMNLDGSSVNTGLSLSQGDIFITRNGGPFFSLVDASAIVHSMLGYYRVPLGSTDLGSTGRLKLVCNKATALPVWDNWAVVTSKVYDSLITASDNLEVDATLIEGTDATNQIRDSIVDDATRIDASGLNTLSGHDPGEAIAGATDTMSANVTQIGGVVQSLTDLKDMVDTGYDPTAHTMASNLTSILGTLLTETAGYLAAGFKKFFNVLNGTGTLLSIPAALPGANGGLPTTNGTKLNQTADLTDAAVDLIWDEVLTAATHNVPSSAGRRLRTLTTNEMRAGTCQAGSAANTIRLDAGASATDGWYDPAVVIIDGGTGEGQCRLIIDYIGASQTCIVNRDWRLTPDNTSTFIVIADPGLETVNEGQATGGTASSVTLNTHAKNISDTYNGCTIVLISGTGRGQSRVITDYDGGTKIALVSEDWTTQPVAGTGYYIFGYGRSHLIPDSLTDVLNAIVDDSTKIDGSALNTLSSHDPGETIAGATDVMSSNITQIGGVVQSATDLKDFVDTGYDPGTHKIAGLVLADAVTGMALESTLTAIKGLGWTTQTLVTLQAAIAAIDVSGVADAVCDEDMTGHVVANSLGAYLRAAYALATGRLKIDDTAKQLILYMPDGVTEIARWNIYNNAGALASTNVFDRQRT